MKYNSKLARFLDGYISVILVAWILLILVTLGVKVLDDIDNELKETKEMLGVYPR